LEQASLCNFSKKQKIIHLQEIYLGFIVSIGAVSKFGILEPPHWGIPLRPEFQDSVSGISDLSL
jgi:hypothetical protein